MRAPQKVRRVALVGADDPAYLEEMSRQAAAHRRLGPRQDPGDLYRASAVVETAVRAWLAARLPLLDERVIDVELLPAGERAYERRFQELDAVVGRDGVPECVVEMKFSASGAAVRRGLAQLARARSLLRHRWGGVGGLLILVEANRSGVELDLERLREVTIIEADRLDGAAALPPTALLVLSIAALTSHLDAATRALIELGHDEGDALTAARQARAAMAASGDVGSDEHGPTLGLPAAQPAVTHSVTFGDDGPVELDESPFAALAGLRLAEAEQTEGPGSTTGA